MQNTLRRTLVPLLAFLGVLLTQFGQAQSGRLPNDPRFDAIIKIDVPAGGIALETYLKAIGMAVKLNVIVEGVPDKKINDDFNGKPFRRIWETVTTLFELDFEMLPEDIVIVGPNSVVSRFRAKPAAPVSTTPTKEVSQRYTYLVKSDPASIQAFLKSEFAGVTVTSIAGSRVLVITATPTDYAAISELLARIDIAPATVQVQASVRKVFKLSNSKAKDVAKVIQDAIAGPQVSTNAQGAQNAQVTALPIAAAPTTVSADEGSNSLIVSGSAEAVDEIAKLIPQLDARQSMVNVNIRIQELTEDTARSLGIDWNFSFGNFAGKVLETGLKFVFDATSALAGLNIGAALNASERQGLSKRINDSTMTIINNGTGKIASGGKIEINLPGAQAISKTLPFGVKMEVKPRISNDGTITLDLKAEVSDVQNKGSIDPNRIDFEEKTSETTVVLQSGQTVLLGSLLSTTQDTSVTGVPILSALPLIGDAFKTRKNNERQSQLLIVLTADLVK